MFSQHARLASATAILLSSIALAYPLSAQTIPAEQDEAYLLGTIVLTAEEQIKQALGVSTITAEDLEDQPVVNDIAEFVRRMPGVNLTGSSPSGQRGNQRQVDIRGMGPENVLILIDGKPVLSRTAVKMGRGGERDTRGDTNWVPAEMIESIEVIRGPAAARYGSGAAGGVVNIITKKPDNDLLQLGLRYNAPENDAEGSTVRGNVLWVKRLSDTVSMRVIGSYNKSEADDADLNAEAGSCEIDDNSGEEVCSYDAGSEGVVNKDLSVMFTWEPTAADKLDLELGWSRQGNLYAGDTQLGGRITDEGDDASAVNELASEGAETNVMERGTFALTHTGSYGWGSTHSFIQYEHTHNRRLTEGAAGGGEGTINSTSDFDTAVLDALSARSEIYLDRTVWGRPSAFTFGAELRYERLDLSDYSSFSSITTTDGSIDSTTADPVSEQTIIGFYVENNLEWTDRLTLTPSFRVDWADTFGTNISGGLNAAFELTPSITVKGGIARAFKSPNLYQLSDYYVYTTRGNGCPYPYYQDGPCYVLGNSDLDPESSLNTELGISYAGINGINATLTWFHNDYDNKIQAGTTQIGTVDVAGRTARLYQWQNVPDSEVEGLEGSFAMPLNDTLSLSVNGTYMITSRQTIRIEGGTTTGGETYPATTIEVPLSLVPKYTINAALHWQATDRLTITPSLTHYGKIEATEFSAHSGYAQDDLEAVDPYTLVNLGLSYEMDNGILLNGGVTNVFDKQILRSGEGANTFNESGRAFYVGLTKTF